MRTYSEIFALREFRTLFLARSVTMAATSIGGLALGATTYADTGSTVLTALSMFGGPLITLLGSMTVLSASDSLGPRRASTVMPLAFAVAWFVQSADIPWGWRLAVLAIPYLVGSATSGSTMRLLHDIVPSEGFVLGRATLNIAVGVMQIAGYGLGGLLLGLLSPSALFLIAASGGALAAAILRLGLSEQPGIVASGDGLVSRTRAVNRALLGSRVIRPLYLALWVPNGLIVGCEALFIPFAGQSAAGYLFATTAAGMLVGDVVMGRVIPPARRDRLIEPLRLLLALPYLGFLLSPSLPVALGLGFLASAGYSASLPLQERLIDATDAASRGQAFGLYSSGLMIGQALGAVLGGVVALELSPAHAMATLSVVSLGVTLALVPGLRRSAALRKDLRIAGRP